MKTKNSALLARLCRNQGSVTAEFVMVLPALLVVLGVCLAAMAMQLSRLGLVDSASMAARALARGEPKNQVISQYASSDQELSVSTFGQDKEILCVHITRTISIKGLGANLLQLKEQSCARRDGL